MEDGNDAFYVVRKGDIVGIYQSFAESQEQAASSICNPSATIYKCYGSLKHVEQHLSSRGLRNASYSIAAADLNDDVFGNLVPCPFQQPTPSYGNSFDKDSRPKRLYQQDVLEPGNVGMMGGCASSSTDSQRKQPKLDNCSGSKPAASNQGSCFIEFDGASKGNPGQAGAGAVLRAEDGSIVSRLREGVGIATNNVAEYRSVILGLKYALKKGFRHVCVQGDSKLVVMQMQGLWKIKHPNMAILCKEAKELKDKFSSFRISHVLREFNSEADGQANLAINLRDGQVVEDHGK